MHEVHTRFNDMFLVYSFVDVLHGTEVIADQLTHGDAGLLL